MRQVDRHLGVSGRHLALKPVTEWQVGRQREYAGQRCRAPQSLEQRNRTALRKAREQNPTAVDPALDFVIDKQLYLIARGTDPLLIRRSIDIRAHNVVPAAHLHSAVDRDRPDRCMGKNKSDARVIG